MYNFDTRNIKIGNDKMSDATNIDDREIMHKLATELFIPHLQGALVSAQKTGSTNIQIIGAASNAFTFFLEDVIGPKATAGLLEGMAEKIRSDLKKSS